MKKINLLVGFVLSLFVLVNQTQAQCDLSTHSWSSFDLPELSTDFCGAPIFDEASSISYNYEYTPINSIPAYAVGNTYEFTTSDGNKYITIYDQDDNVLAYGFEPQSVTITAAMTGLKIQRNETDACEEDWSGSHTPKVACTTCGADPVAPFTMDDAGNTAYTIADAATNAQSYSYEADADAGDIVFSVSPDEAGQLVVVDFLSGPGVETNYDYMYVWSAVDVASIDICNPLDVWTGPFTSPTYVANAENESLFFSFDSDGSVQRTLEFNILDANEFCHLECPDDIEVTTVGCSTPVEYTVALGGICEPEVIGLTEGFGDGTAGDFTLPWPSENHPQCQESDATTLTMYGLDPSNPCGTINASTPWNVLLTSPGMITATAPTQVTFTWDYTCGDMFGSSWDPFGYFLNSDPVILSPSDLDNGETANGTVTIDMAAGDELLIFQWGDYYTGSGTTVISDFSVSIFSEPGVEYVSGPQSGDELAPGTYDVHYTATLGDGSPAECEFTITVNGFGGDPLNCPEGDMVMNLGSEDCTIEADYADVYEHACSYTIVAGPEQGAALSAGTYPVEIEATDALGATYTCEFNIVVNPFAGPVDPLNCNSGLQISLDEDCSVVLSPDMFLEGTYGCYDAYTVDLVRNQHHYGNVATSENIGETYTAIISDSATGNSCMAMDITFEDKMAPTIECAVGASDAFVSGSLTSSDPTFNRPWRIPCTLSGVGTAVHYDTFDFSVDGSDTYTFTCDYSGDGYGLIYESPFNPADPCSNLVALNDDGAGGLDPEIITALLDAGDYVLVTTTFANGSTGDYTWTYSSLGSGTLIYEGANAGTNEFFITCMDSMDDVPLPTASDNCDPSPDVVMVDQWFIDNEYCDYNGERVMIRTFKAVDWNGMESELCSQVIHISRVDVTIPSDVTITCDEYAANPGLIAATESGAGVPTGYNGSNSFCEWNMSYSDLTLDHCGPGTFKIIRTWTVLNLCSNEVTRVDQVILVDDVEGPEFTFDNPAFVDNDGSIELHVNANVPAHGVISCRSTEFIPAPSYDDNCSGAVSLQIFTAAGEVVNYQTAGGAVLGGFLPEPGLAIGSYSLLYQAFDACGNVSEEFITLVVEDEITPDVVCEGHRQAPLNNTGFNTIYAESFDDGTTDNCCLDHFEVARMNGTHVGAFGPSVTFDCSDLDETQMVVFRAYDCYDNFSDCMVEVEVVDKSKPSCIAPADMELTCLDLPGDLDLNDHDVANEYFGTPNAIDNCGAEIQYLSVSDHRNECGVGTIERRFRAKDNSNNLSARCSQVIEITEVHDYTINIPADPRISNCTESNPNDLTVDVEGCDIIAVDSEDQILNISEDGACYKILRTYTILNECVWNGVDEPVVLDRVLGGSGVARSQTIHLAGGDDDNGYYTYKQYIRVDDDTPPTVEYAGDNEFCAGLTTEHGEAPCEGYVELPITYEDACTDELSASWTLFEDVDGDGYFIVAAPHNDVVLGTGEGTFSGNLEAGHYGVAYLVEDGCGNTAEEIIIFDVNDCKNPSISCDELVIELMNNDDPMVVVTPEMYLQPCPGCGLNVTDNCPGELKVSFSADVTDRTRTYTCADLGPNNIIQIWVTDAAGNQTYCETNTIVQANDDQCPTDGPHVGGVLATELNNGIADVAVQLNGDFNATTNTDGGYEVEVDRESDVTIVPQLDNNTHIYVSTMDLIEIRNHILHPDTEGFTSPYQWVAADANNSHSVTGLDMIEIRRYILGYEGYQEGFPNVTTWRFIDASYRFPMVNPLSADFPEVINYNNVLTNHMEGNFVGVVIGDLNGSWDNSLLGSEDRSAGEFVMNAADAVVTAGETFTVDFTAQDMNVKGYQFTLNFDADALAFDEIVPGVAKAENFGLSFVEEGFITTSWNGEASDEILFSVTFTAKADGQLSDMVSVASRYTKAEAYGTDNELKDVKLHFDSGVVADGFALYQNNPNPFSDYTTIDFDLPEAAQATLTVMDVSGKVIKVVKTDGTQGRNSVKILSSELAGSGVLYYRLDTPTHTATKSMIIIE